MKMKRRLIGLCIVLTFITAVPSESSAQTTQSVAVVFVFEVPLQQVSAMMGIVARVRALVRGHEPRAEMNVYASTFAGPNLDRIVVLTEFPSAEVWGAASATINADPQYQRFVREVDALEGVELVSRSLMSNITPQ